MILTGPMIHDVLTRTTRWDAAHAGASPPPEPDFDTPLGPGVALRVTPYDPARLNPNSLNLCLGGELLVYEKHAAHHEAYTRLPHHALTCPPEPLDMAREEPTVPLTILPHPYGLVLYPGVLYLGATAEVLELRGLAAQVEGRSSCGRLGLSQHETAGFIDDGFRGQVTMELTVAAPVRVYPHHPVCQVVFFTTVGPRRPYAGQYLGQRGPRPSGMWREFPADPPH